MTVPDHNLLNEITHALNAAPFAAMVSIFGQPMSRPTVRAMERQMLRLRVSQRSKEIIHV